MNRESKKALGNNSRSNSIKKSLSDKDIGDILGAIMDEPDEVNGNLLNDEGDNLNNEIMKNVLLFIETGNEKYHGLAVKDIKYRDGLTRGSANKVFWIIRNTVAKKGGK